MQKTTVFAIKTNIAIVLLSVLITFLAALIFGDLFQNGNVAGIFSILVSFVSVYFTTWTVLKNSHLTKADALASIDKTWKVYLIVYIVLALFDITNTLARGVIFTIFTVLTFVAAYAAFAVLKKRQQ